MRPYPSVIVSDVNETLSDMAPLAGRFTDVGAAGTQAGLWFASETPYPGYFAAPDLPAPGLAALAGQIASRGRA